MVKALAEASRTKNKWDVFHGLAEFRCITGVVQNAEELLAFEQLKVSCSRYSRAGSTALSLRVQWIDANGAKALRVREQARDFFVESTIDGVRFQAPGPVTKCSASPWTLRLSLIHI